jgi:hypothetical protein
MPTKDPRWAHYVDSALFGSGHGVECIVAFFGSDRVLFGTDTPFDNKDGGRTIPPTAVSPAFAARTTAQGSPGVSRKLPALPCNPLPAYLWERVWEKDAWLDLLGRFVHVERPAKGSKSSGP